MKYRVFVFLLSMLFGSLKAQEVRDSLVVYDVDKRAQFEGGVLGWNQFVKDNLNIRSLAGSLDSATYVTYGAKQRAVMEFTVCEDGVVCDIEVVNKEKISPEFAKEALRVLKKSPRWLPASKNGEPVRSRFKQAIIVVL